MTVFPSRPSSVGPRHYTGVRQRPDAAASACDKDLPSRHIKGDATDIVLIPSSATDRTGLSTGRPGRPSSSMIRGI
jgi:hypothetical protein